MLSVFKEGTDIYLARQLIAERLRQAADEIPDQVKPDLGPIATGLGEIYLWTIDASPVGLVLLVVVTEANVQDRDGARTLLSVLATEFRRLRVIWADGAYAGALQMWVRGLRKWGKVRLDIVRKAKGQRGFAVVPWRWIVERTFAWLGRYRRLKSDYECLPETTEALVYIAMIRLMVRRLAV